MKKRLSLTVLCFTALFICAVPLAAQNEDVLSLEQFLQMGHSSAISDVTWSPNGRRIATGAQDNTVKIWDAETGRVIRTLAGHTNIVYTVNYSPDSRRIVSGSRDKTIKIWDVETGQEIRTLSGHSGNVMSAIYSPDGRYILSSSNDRTLKIWNAETGQEIKTLTGHSGGVTSATYSPDGRRIVSCSEDDTIKIWDAESGREIKNINGHNGRILSVSFSPDGRRIATVSRDKTIKIWDTETGRELRTIPTGAYAYSVRYSPDGKRILCGSYDNTVKIYDAETGREIRSLTGHGDAVFAVSYSPDGRRILSGSMDNTVKIWDAETGREITQWGIPVPLTRDMIAEYLALAGDSARNEGAFSGPSLYRSSSRETALHFGALASKALAEKRFLDPQNSAALRRGEALLQSLAGKGGVSRADIDAYYRQAIGTLITDTVNAEFNKISFLIDRTNTVGSSYGAILTRNIQNHYVLNYEGYFGKNEMETKTVSGTSLDVLLAEMARSRDFVQDDINQVRAQAALIPAAALTSRALDDIKTILTSFYTNPNTGTYSAARDVFVLYNSYEAVTGNSLFGLLRTSYYCSLQALNPALAERVSADARNRSNVSLPQALAERLISLRQ